MGYLVFVILWERPLSSEVGTDSAIIVAVST